MNGRNPRGPWRGAWIVGLLAGTIGHAANAPKLLSPDDFSAAEVIVTGVVISLAGSSPEGDYTRQRAVLSVRRILWGEEAVAARQGRQQIQWPVNVDIEYLAGPEGGTGDQVSPALVTMIPARAQPPIWALKWDSPGRCFRWAFAARESFIPTFPGVGNHTGYVDGDDFYPPWNLFEAAHRQAKESPSGVGWQANGTTLAARAIRPNSPAAQAQVKMGDLLVKAAGTSITSLQEWDLAFAHLRPGSNAEVVVNRPPALAPTILNWTVPPRAKPGSAGMGLTLLPRIMAVVEASLVAAGLRPEEVASLQVHYVSGPGLTRPDQPEWRITWQFSPQTVGGVPIRATGLSASVVVGKEIVCQVTGTRYHLNQHQPPAPPPISWAQAKERVAAVAPKAVWNAPRLEWVNPKPPPPASSGLTLVDGTELSLRWEQAWVPNPAPAEIRGPFEVEANTGEVFPKIIPPKEPIFK